MKQRGTVTLALAFLISLAGGSIVTNWVRAQSTSPQKSPQATAQIDPHLQKQLDRLKQLDQQLQKDREALHISIDKHGWNSEETDAAWAQLFEDRQEYRILRRSLRAAGVSVTPSTGQGDGLGRGGTMRSGPGHHGGAPPVNDMYDCPCRN